MLLQCKRRHPEELHLLKRPLPHLVRFPSEPGPGTGSMGVGLTYDEEAQLTLRQKRELRAFRCMLTTSEAREYYSRELLRRAVGLEIRDGIDRLHEHLAAHHRLFTEAPCGKPVKR